MAINAIGSKLLMVRTVAQCVKIKINQKFSPTTNLCMNYGLQMKAMSAIENMSRQIGKTCEPYASNSKPQTLNPKL